NVGVVMDVEFRHAAQRDGAPAMTEARVVIERRRGTEEHCGAVGEPDALTLAGARHRFDETTTWMRDAVEQQTAGRSPDATERHEHDGGRGCETDVQAPAGLAKRAHSVVRRHPHVDASERGFHVYRRCRAAE